ARALAQPLAGGPTMALRGPVHPPPWAPWLPTVEPAPARVGFSPSAWSALPVAGAGGALMRFTVHGGRSCGGAPNRATAPLGGSSKLELPRECRFTVIGAMIGVVAALNSWRQRRLR